jgi:hypothetical protein
MIIFLAACAFAILWGAAENRLFREQDIGWELFDHFKPYHLFLVSLTLLVAFLGCEGSVLKFVFLALWTVLGLDVTWWLIRYRDFKVNPNASKQYFGETNAWHQREDWDNCPLPLIGKPELIFGCYWWWLLFSILLTGLGLRIIL